METKDVVWLTGISVGLWFVPTLAVAAEVPEVVSRSSEEQHPKPVNDLAMETAAMETVPRVEPAPSIEAKKADAKKAEQLPEPTPAPEPLQPVSREFAPPPPPPAPADRPAPKPAPIAPQDTPPAAPLKHSTPPETPPASSIEVSTEASTEISTEASPTTSTEASTAKLYGEPDPIPDVQPSADPLEHLSTEEWLDLISEPPEQRMEERGVAGRLGTEQRMGYRQGAGQLGMGQQVEEQGASPPGWIDTGSADPESSSEQGAVSTAARSAAVPGVPPLVSRSAADLISASSQSASSQSALTQSASTSAPLLGRGSDQWLGLAGLAGQQGSQLSQGQLLNRAIHGAGRRGAVPVGSSVTMADAGLAGSMAQVTSVSQLSDVQPTDWAYQALQSLVERYGVIEGYPDGLFRGERALTRFEFAAGVNAAMDRLTQLLASSMDNAVPQTDLETIKRLQDDFSMELAGLRGRVDGLEARVTELEANQFSTTVVLNGQVTFGLADAWGGDPPGLGETNPVFAYLAQLQLSGSFSERDAFRIDFDAGNFAGAGFAEPQALNTQMALMGFQTDTNNTLELSGAEYRFAVGDRLVLTLKPVGFSLNSVLSPNSIYSSVSQGALSRFAAETPIFRIGSLDAGMGLDWLMTDRLRLQLAYGARDAGDPLQGLFKSDHRALGVQLLARPFGAFTTGIAYVNAFADDGFLDTFTGSNNADISGGFLEPAAIHAISGTFQWQIVPSVVVGAWGGLTITDSLSSDAVAVSSTYLFSLGFPDTFGREGDLLGILVGQPLRLRYGLLIEREDQGSGLHYEIFYRIRVNDNIAITPGVFVVTDPGHISNNDTIVVAALRTSFSF